MIEPNRVGFYLCYNHLVACCFCNILGFMCVFSLLSSLCSFRIKFCLESTNSKYDHFQIFLQRIAKSFLYVCFIPWNHKFTQNKFNLYKFLPKFPIKIFRDTEIGPFSKFLLFKMSKLH